MMMMMMSDDDMDAYVAAETLMKMSGVQLDTKEAERLKAAVERSKGNIRKAMKRSIVPNSRSSPYHPVIDRNIVQRRQQRHRHQPGKLLPLMGTPLRSLFEDYSTNTSSCWEKVLWDSDIIGGQGRLLFNGDFAEAVIHPMLNEGENPREGVKVVVYDDKCRTFKMSYKCWGGGDDKSKSKKEVYVLTSGWNDFHLIRLKSGQTISRFNSGQTIYLWVFRHITRRLCFAISTIQPQ